MDKPGIVIINKEKGFTSHDVVAIVRRTLKTKAGHTGTLDPQAEGVLPVCVGKATRLADYLMANDKTYIATVCLGVTTDTGDATGTVLTQSPVDFDPDKISAVVSTFAGEQFQTPPMYSAIKVNGQKLYKLARKGETVEREPRKVFINAINILDFNAQQKTFRMEADCSKGTYIRTLCEDIGKALGYGACMGSLVRTRTGSLTLSMAVKLASLTEADVLPPEAVMPYPAAQVLPQGAKLALNGNPIPAALVNYEEAEGFFWLYLDESLIGLYKLAGGKFTPEVMLV